MNGQAFKPGDMVVYRDRDEIEWGPWKVFDISGNTVTLLVERSITCSADASLLRRVDWTQEVA